jgi:CDP-glucose 4,6-dehydratase
MEGLAGTAVLVTGAQGFIGSWLVERLLDEGARVVAPRRPATPGSRFVREGLEERCELAQLDLGDLASTCRVLAEDGVGVVFHLAAQTLAGEASRSPLATFEANVRATYVLLEACRLTGAVNGSPPRVVIASSYHAYGEYGGRPYLEELPLRPGGPYEVSKACADLIGRSYAATCGLPVAVTRLANVYGGGDLNFSRLVPDAARALASGERPVIRSDGTPERDYLYVEDAVEAYLAVAGSLRRPELAGRAWNAGSGAPVAVGEVVRRLVSASGLALEPDVLGEPDPRAEIDRQELDSSAIREELGWEPSWDLDRGLATTWGWYERRLTGEA